MARSNRIPTVTPGELLLEDFLAPAGITRYRLAQATKLPNTRIADIVHGRRAITADTAVRFARFFGNSPQFWMNLQADYDLRIALRKLRGRVEREVKPLHAA